jgi:predicted RNA polymerase sigma factor
MKNNGYHRPGVRAHLLSKLGRFAEAKAEFERTASMTRNERERDLLRGRPEAGGSRRRRKSNERGPGRTGPSLLAGRD